MNKFWILILAASIALSGCAKRQAQLSVKTTEEERYREAAQSVKRVEIRYRDPAGLEKTRESFEINGLKEPADLNSAKLKDLEVEERGSFEATAYDSGSKAVFQGTAQVPEDGQKKIEIELLRPVQLITSVGAKSVGPNSTGAASPPFTIDTIHQARDRGLCVDLPELMLYPHEDYVPVVFFNLSIKARLFRYDLGRFEKSGQFEPLVETKEIEFDPNGDGVVPLKKVLSREFLFSKHQAFSLRVFTTHYEGCLNVGTRVALLPIVQELDLHFEHVGRHENSLKPVLVLKARNPNEIPAWTYVSASIRHVGDTELLFSLDGAERGLWSLGRAKLFGQWFLIAPKASADIYVYGGYDSGKGVVQKGSQVIWTARARPEWGGEAEEVVTGPAAPGIASF